MNIKKTFSTLKNQWNKKEKYFNFNNFNKAVIVNLDYNKISDFTLILKTFLLNLTQTFNIFLKHSLNFFKTKKITANESHLLLDYRNENKKIIKCFISKHNDFLNLVFLLIKTLINVYPKSNLLNNRLLIKKLFLFVSNSTDRKSATEKQQKQQQSNKYTGEII